MVSQSPSENSVFRPTGGEQRFFLLKAALDELWRERQDFRLDVHFTLPEMSPYIKTYDRYGYSQLEEIFENTDVLAVPSVWYETFGYTALEALSYGVPVIMSDTVGAKDILADGAGIEDITADKVRIVLDQLTPESLQQMNQCIVDNQDIMTLNDMWERIEKECYR